jgi:hypothetical protein
MIDAPELAYQFLLLADARQSQYALDRPREFREVNPLVRKYGVKKYFIASSISHAFVTYNLPEKWRPYWAYGTVAVQAGFVAHNAHVGVRIRF